MAIADPSQLKEYMYQVTEFKIMIGGDIDDVPPHCISGMNITNNYETDLYPVFKVEMVVTAERYYKIMANKQTVKFKLRVQKFYVAPSSEEKSMYRDWINDTFSLIMDDKDENPDMPSVDAKLTSASSEAEKNTHPMELYFYRDEVATAMKTVINEVMASGTMTDAVNVVCSAAKIRNLLMSPLENQTVYSQLILPSLNIHEELQHLDAHYGFYKNGSIIYFGIEDGYILNYKGGCTAYQSGEIQQTNFLVLAKDSPEALESGMIMKNDGQFNIHWKMSDMKINNDSITMDVLGGNNVSLLDASSSSVISATSNAPTQGNANTQVKKNETENQWMAQTMIAQNNANGTVISGSVSNVDLAALTPNKKFTVIFEDSSLANKYRGLYLISSEEIRFVNRGGVDFEVVVGLTIKKVA